MQCCYVTYHIVYRIVANDRDMYCIVEKCIIAGLIYIWQLSSFKVPMLCFIYLTVLLAILNALF